MVATLYLLTTASGETYTGYTRKSLDHRAKLHAAKAYRKNPSQRVHQAIRAEGHKFSLRALCVGELAYIQKLEEAATVALKPSLNVNVGSKMSGDALERMRAKMTGRKHSDATKAAMSEAKKGNQNALGMKQSEAHKKRLSELAALRRGAKGRFE